MVQYGLSSFGSPPFGVDVERSVARHPVGSALAVFVNGLQALAVRSGSFSVAATLRANAECSFVLIDPTGFTAILPGEDIEAYHLGRKIFGGTVEQAVESFPVQDISSPHKEIEVRAVDWSHVATRRLVTTGFIRQSAGDIIRALVEDYLEPEGIVIDSIDQGLEIGPFTFEDRHVSDCLDTIAQQIGYEWQIDFHRRFRFFARESFSAPWSLDATGERIGAIQCRRSRTSYRNVQIVRGGRDLGAPIVRSFVADGETTTWALDDDVGEAPEVEVDGVPQTIGIRGIQDDDDSAAPAFFWRKGDKSISQNRSHTKLAAGKVLEVTYRRLIPIVSASIDQTAIDERISVEGGTGRYEAVARESQIENAELAAAFGESFLRQHAQIGCVITVRTPTVGILPGQLQDVELPIYGISGQFLVTRAELQDMGGNHMETVYEAVDNVFDGGWPEFYKRLARSLQSFGAQESITVASPIATAGTNVFIDTDDVEAPDGNLLGDWQDDPYSVALVGTAVVGYSYVDDEESGIVYNTGSIVGEVRNP